MPYWALHISKGKWESESCNCSKRFCSALREGIVTHAGDATGSAITTTAERLRTTLAALSLTAIDARLETLLEMASKKEPSYGDFLLRGSAHPRGARPLQQ